MNGPAPRWLLLLIAVAGMLAGIATILLAHGAHAHHSATSSGAPRKPVIQGGLPPTRPPLPSPAPALSALQTTEAFAAAYIDFIYGHRPADAVAHASRSLRGRLTQLHPQQPAAITAAAAPQLTSVRVTPTAKNTATSTAVIADGPALSAIVMRLQKRHGAWIVIDLSENG